MSKCSTTAIAHARKLQLVNVFGLDPEIVHIHPENEGSPQMYGSKVLGSYIGHDDYILQQLECRGDSFQIDADAIMTVHSKQTQYLLLKWCFSQKIIYIQRTTPTYLVNASLVPRFTQQKKEILINILGRNEIDDKNWALSQLHCQDSGLGLAFSEQTSHAAYIASVVETLKVKKIFGIQWHQDKMLPNIKMTQDIKNSVEFIRLFSRDISLPVIMREFYDAAKSQGNTLQHGISSLFREINRSKVLKLFHSRREQAWLESTNDLNASLWLDIAPKSSMHKMTSAQFEAALNLRLFLPQNCILPGSKCNCGKIVDSEAIHFTTGCNYDGVRIDTHNRIRDLVGQILNYSGSFTKSEEKGVFQAEEPDCNNRPDLTVFNLPGYVGKYLLDIQITSPVPSGSATTKLSATQSKKALRAANNAAKVKKKKYDVLCSSSGLGFLPIIFETTGRMNESTNSFFSVLIKKASEVKGIPFTVLWRYWISAVGSILAKSLADGISKRAYTLYSTQFNTTHENSKKAVADFEYVDVNFAGALGFVRDG
jgi:hypothetical protein